MGFRMVCCYTYNPTLFKGFKHGKVFFQTTCLDVLCLFSQGDMNIAKPRIFRHAFELGFANREEQISKNCDDMINYTYIGTCPNPGTPEDTDHHFTKGPVLNFNIHSYKCFGRTPTYFHPSRNYNSKALENRPPS